MAETPEPAMPTAPESEKTLPTIEPLRPTREPPPKQPGPVSRTKSALQYLQAEISLKHADIPIIACCFVSGLCDSSAYNAWTCFVSMQTGQYSTVTHSDLSLTRSQEIQYSSPSVPQGNQTITLMDG
jgi:hypothetical protein